MMQTLVNWSVYPSDVERFADGWHGIARYVADFGLDGVELLIGAQPLADDIPAGLVHGTHLPLWLSWLDIWRNDATAVSRYFPEAEPWMVNWYGGGQNPADMVRNLAGLWQLAATSEASYMVWHVSHCEPAHAFTRAFTYDDEEVVDALAQVLNATAVSFPHHEPPITLALENVWWPGLTFRRSDIALRLAERLQFDNWCFVLDPAHLMNTNHALRSEDEAIDFVLETIANLDPAVIARIQVVHLNQSLSGSFQQEAIQRGLPPRFAELPYADQFSLTQPMIYCIDRHQPFTLPRCREIVTAVSPHTVVHEFTSSGLDELDKKLTVQLKAFNRKKSG